MRRHWLVMQVPAAKSRHLDAPDMTAPRVDRVAAVDEYAPKKPHLDLKRDIAKKLHKLDRETQRAIDELGAELALQQQREATQAAGAPAD